MLEKSITLTATFDKTTQKYSFASSTTVQLLATHDDALAQELGLPRGTVLNVQKGDPPVEAPNVADLNGSVHAIYVRTNLATRSVMESRTGGVSDILAKIDINMRISRVFAPVDSTKLPSHSKWQAKLNRSRLSLGARVGN